MSFLRSERGAGVVVAAVGAPEPFHTEDLVALLPTTVVVLLLSAVVLLAILLVC